MVPSIVPLLLPPTRKTVDPDVTYSIETNQAIISMVFKVSINFAISGATVVLTETAREALPQSYFQRYYFQSISNHFIPLPPP